MANSPNECSSRRDGPLAQELANKLSIVINSNPTIYKNSPNANHVLDEQEQVSPLGRLIIHKVFKVKY